MNVSYPTTLIPEKDNIVKFAVKLGDSSLVLGYMKDVLHKLELYSLESGTFCQEIEMPIIGVVSEHYAFNDEFYFKVDNLAHPGAIVRCQLSDAFQCQAECSVWKELRLKDVSPLDYKMEQFLIPSVDGTKVPLFIASHKDLQKDGGNLAFLYGYGGFTVDVLPTFNPMTFAFVSYFGGIYASTNIRGGG